jgi:hypothetical protein
MIFRKIACHRLESFTVTFLGAIFMELAIFAKGHVMIANNDNSKLCLDGTNHLDGIFEHVNRAVIGKVSRVQDRIDFRTWKSKRET